MSLPEKKMDCLPVGPESLLLARSAVPVALGEIKNCANSRAPVLNGFLLLFISIVNCLIGNIEYLYLVFLILYFHSFNGFVIKFNCYLCDINPVLGVS